MFNEFSVRPKPSNNKAKYVALSCMVTALAALIICLFITVYSGFVGIVVLAFLTAAIFIYIKYLSASYYYDIMVDSEGFPLLIIRQRTGKRDTTFCRIYISSITKIDRESREERKEHETPKGYARYYYVPTMDPDSVLRITSVSRHEKCEIVIEATDEFAELLLNYASKAREIELLQSGESD